MTVTTSPIDQLQADLRSELLRAAHGHPRARLTRRGQMTACLAVVAAIATPTAAVALQGDEEERWEPFTPAPAPLCIDNPDLPECSGTIAPQSDDGSPPIISPNRPGDDAEEDALPSLTPEQRRELLPTSPERPADEGR